MSGFKDKITDRLADAAKAKQDLLERFKAKVDDPAILQKQAERVAIAAARDQRQAERKAAKEAEAIRLKEEAARAAIEQAEREAAEKLAQEAAEKALAFEQKKKRDARYAARKKKKR